MINFSTARSPSGGEVIANQSCCTTLGYNVAAKWVQLQWVADSELAALPPYLNVHLTSMMGNFGKSRPSSFLIVAKTRVGCGAGET